MRKIRYIIFGYQVADGKIIPHPVEAELVRQIFSRYLVGSSYSEIAKAMDKTGYPYSESTENRGNERCKEEVTQQKKGRNLC